MKREVEATVASEMVEKRSTMYRTVNLPVKVEITICLYPFAFDHVSHHILQRNIPYVCMFVSPRLSSWFFRGENIYVWGIGVEVGQAARLNRYYNNTTFRGTEGHLLTSCCYWLLVDPNVPHDAQPVPQRAEALLVGVGQAALLKRHYSSIK